MNKTKPTTLSATRLLLLILTPLSLLISACNTPSQTLAPIECPPPVQMPAPSPALMLPPPAPGESSRNAAQNIESWRQQLTDLPAKSLDYKITPDYVRGPTE